MNIPYFCPCLPLFHGQSSITTLVYNKEGHARLCNISEKNGFLCR